MGSFISFEALNLHSAKIPFCRDGDKDYLNNQYNMDLFGEKIAFRLMEDGGRFISSDRLQSVYRQLGDDEVDNILCQLMEEGRPLGASEDLLLLAEECYQGSICGVKSVTKGKANQLLADFYDHYTTVPLWYDTDQIERGREVFLAYYGAIGLSLFYRSLAPGFSIPKIAAVLLKTGYLAPPSNTRSVRNRLLDTGAFLWAALSETTTQSLRPVSGAGWRAALQVRVLHAKVRHAIRNKKGERRWDTEKLGIPINQEDLSLVLLAFSMNSLLGCETILGFPMPEQEQLDYLAFWRYLGWLLGVQCDETDAKTQTKVEDDKWDRPLDPCGPGWIESSPNTLAHALACSYSSSAHLINPDETSVIICHHILRTGRPPKTPSCADLGFYFNAKMCRYFIGNALADALELPIHPNFIQRTLVDASCLTLLCFVRLYSWAALPWSPLRQRIVSTHQKHCASLLQRWQSGEILKKSRAKSLATNDTKTLLPTGGSGCPFAMIAPPNLG